MARTAIALSAGLLLGSIPAAAQVTAFVDGRVIDGAGHVIEHGTVVVRDGVITEVGPAASVRAPQGANRIDLRGKTLMPGIVNAHGHLSAVFGLKSGPEYYTRDNLVRQLRAYATYGVTTVFSLGDDDAEAFALRAEQAEAPPGRARVFLAGPSVFAETAEAATVATDKVIALRPDLIKIRVDDNLGTSKKMPEAAWRATLERARAAHLRLGAHLFYLSDATALARAGADFIVHSVRDLPVNDAFIKAMKANNACYSPTLMREVSTFVYDSAPPWTKDPFFHRGYSEEISAELEDPARHARIKASPGWAQGQKYKAGLEVARGNLKRVSNAGIRIAMGTDTGPAGRFQGFFEHLELEMMVASGLSPMQAIVSATGDAALCWGKQGAVGTIAKGGFADLLVLGANPLDAIANTRSLDAIYIGGRRFDSPR
ncbi:MAG: amidohydrolase family protein [Vicinamibacteria bacterium]|nr:amidohydrolase family protein [Vicinamibacteria bacterium]